MWCGGVWSKFGLANLRGLINYIDSMIYLLLLLKELISVKLLKSALPALLKSRFSMTALIFQFFNFPHSFSCTHSGKKASYVLYRLRRILSLILICVVR